jgi:hypothetical protein
MDPGFSHRDSHDRELERICEAIPFPYRAAGSVLRSSSTRVQPDDDFPADLTTVPLMELQVLDSRVRRQLDHETLVSCHGPHPVTVDRQHELVTEIDARELLGADPGAGPLSSVMASPHRPAAD